METILNFIFKSSADPKKISLSVKFTLLAIVPYLMHVLDLVCQFGHQCYNIDPSLLTTAIEAIADGTFYLLSLVSVIGVLVGLFRKVKRTIQGTNLAL